ncbi:MAG: hypothetical protein FD143_584 [Ignavibacteria bacterium]|nr:MAG: hypothetical protein FD143_584 [Ignavibacteria bacterium]KAF0161655.1 MAG: hypothetical protein FD188_772 [Ignavibacteria bacterium]
MNVKIDSGNIKALKQSILELQKVKNAEFKKELLEQKMDLKQISSDSTNLKNIDAETSTVNYNNQSIDFNLVFNFFAAIQVLVEGKIEREENTLEICFKHSFQRELIITGNKISKTFLFELKMKATFEESKPEENKFEREDILKFIERLAGELFDSFNNHSNTLRALVINEKHFEKITGSGKKELAGLIQTLLGTVISFIKHKDAAAQNAGFYSQRYAQETKEYFVKEIESFTAEIRQLDEAPKTTP